uniref:Bifunctional metallophosphatase/5'-nucleotidase n=1 Tax=Eiseniibacteriota bacterium TaxID=2212470 RepID=A0A832MKR9_UNCEI
MSRSRVRLSAVLAVLALAAAPAAFASSAPAKPAAGKPAGRAAVVNPSQVCVVSLTDTKAKYLPCGCNVPKGGWARQSFFVDSLRGQFGQLVFVDAGGFFPEGQSHRELAAFFMEGMAKLEFDAVGVGDRDLKYGIEFLTEHVKRHGLPVVSANLVYRANKQPVFPPHVLKQVGGVKVGVFSLLSPEVDLGPSREALAVREPMQAAADAVKALRAQGANVVVLLSQLGKVGSEDVPLNVEGIDLVIGGRNVPLLQRARSVNGALVVHGGEQGQYIGRTVISLDGAKKVTGAECELVALAPAISDKPDFAAMIKAHEERHPQQSQNPPAAAPAAGPGKSPAPGTTSPN